jgi:hypothetical protein
MVVLLTIYLFYLAANKSGYVLTILLAWFAMQGVISATDFYAVTDRVPPRPFLLVAMPLLFIIFLFVTKWGREFTDSLDLKMLIMLHVVRLPIPLLLYAVYLSGGMPEMMTFMGNNYDIIAGITAPVVYYFAFVKRKLGRNMLLLWNFIGLGLFINLVIIAVLSIPSPLQRFNFDRPNTALLHFPFTWLRCIVVPLVLYSHLAAIRQLTRRAPAE